MLKIGEPQGAGSINKPLEELWRMEVEKNFKKIPEEDAREQQSLNNMHKFAEEKVDKMRMQKDQELEDYKREIERAKRFEKSKLM